MSLCRINTNISKRILNELETVFLRLREIEVEGVAVIKLRVNNGGDDGTSCFKIKIRTDAAKLTNVRITRFKQCRDLVRERERERDVHQRQSQDCVQGERY